MENNWASFYLYFPSGDEDEDKRLMRLAAVVLTMERMYSDKVLQDFTCSREYEKLIKRKEKSRWKES